MVLQLKKFLDGVAAGYILFLWSGGGKIWLRF